MAGRVCVIVNYPFILRPVRSVFLPDTIIKSKEKEKWNFSPLLLRPRQRDVDVTWPGAIANKFSLISDISPYMTLGGL
jgi:hypothetical protein